MTAEEYKDILMSRNVAKLKEISESIEFKEFYFSVRPKMQMYSNISKKKLYAFRIEEVNMKNDHKKLLKYIKGNAIIYAILAPLMMFIEVIMDLNQPKLMSDIIDIGVANGDISYVLNSFLIQII